MSHREGTIIGRSAPQRPPTLGLNAQDTLRCGRGGSRQPSRVASGLLFAGDSETRSLCVSPLSALMETPSVTVPMQANILPPTLHTGWSPGDAAAIPFIGISPTLPAIQLVIGPALGAA